MKKDENRSLAIFDTFRIRRHYDEEKEKWYFSVIDIVAALTDQKDYQTARKYWNKLKERLRKEGNESVTNCHQLKMEAQDGKKYMTDAADPETFLRLIQSVLRGKPEWNWNQKQAKVSSHPKTIFPRRRNRGR